ncbi:MAG: hypothetical protein ACTSRG_17485 [Candidatus Helarchaeota archaeon]
MEEEKLRASSISLFSNPIQVNSNVPPPNTYAEIYFKTYLVFFKILKKLSLFTEIFKFSIKKDFIGLNCITPSRICLIYLKLSNYNSLFKFYQEGNVYINSKKLLDAIGQYNLKNSIVKLIFKTDSLNFLMQNKKVKLINEISDDHNLNEIPIDGFENLKYCNKVRLSRHYLENFISVQEKCSDVIKLKISNGQILFISNEENNYLSFSLKDIKRIVNIISKACNYLKLYAEEGKPLKLKVDLKQLGKSKLISYFSQHV